MITKISLRMQQLWVKQADIVKYLNVNKVSVYLWYHGKVEPNRDNKEKLAEFLKDEVKNLF